VCTTSVYGYSTLVNNEQTCRLRCGGPRVGGGTLARGECVDPPVGALRPRRRPRRLPGTAGHHSTSKPQPQPFLSLEQRNVCHKKRARQAEKWTSVSPSLVPGRPAHSFPIAAQPGCLLVVYTLAASSSLARPLVPVSDQTWLFARSVPVYTYTLAASTLRDRLNLDVCSHCTSVGLPVHTRRINTEGPSGRPWGLAASTYDDRLAALAGPAHSFPDRSFMVQLRRR